MPQTAAIAASSSGDNTIVAAVAGYKYRVIGWVVSFGGTVNAKWKSGASADLTGPFYGALAAVAFGPDIPVSAGNVPGPHFVTNSGDALVLNLSGAVAVGGYVVYERLPANL